MQSKYRHDFQMWRSGSCYIDGVDDYWRVGGNKENIELLDIKDNYLVFGNEKTKVTESDGRTWHTKEPAVLYFFKDKWFKLLTYQLKPLYYPQACYW